MGLDNNNSINSGCSVKKEASINEILKNRITQESQEWEKALKNYLENNQKYDDVKIIGYECLKKGSMYVCMYVCMWVYNYKLND